MYLYNNFLDFWMTVAEEKKIPVYFFRYEDLVTNPYPVFKDIFEFALN